MILIESSLFVVARRAWSRIPRCSPEEEESGRQRFERPHFVRSAWPVCQRGGTLPKAPLECLLDGFPKFSKPCNTNPPRHVVGKMLDL